MKPKKKNFQTVEEKKEYINEYSKKKKTELCKNFMTIGTCRFADKVNFFSWRLQKSTHPLPQLQKRYKFSVLLRARARPAAGQTTPAE